MERGDEPLTAPPLTGCWQCNHSYPITDAACPACHAANANVDRERAADQAIARHNWNAVERVVRVLEAANGRYMNAIDTQLERLTRMRNLRRQINEQKLRLADVEREADSIESAIDVMEEELTQLVREVL